MKRIGRLLSASYSCESAMYIYSAAYRRLLPHRTSMFITAMPKSGSTFLLAAVREVTGSKEAMLTYAFERNEQELYLPRLIDNQFRQTVTRHHTRATAPNLELLRRFRIKPVVLVRDFFDVVISIRNHLDREGRQNFPSLYATGSFYSMSKEEQNSFVIAYALPWYVQFYVSWYEAWQEGHIDLLWLRYEDLVEDWAGAVDRVLAFNGIHRTAEQIESAITKAYSDDHVTKRLNKTTPGRGRGQLTDLQCERIRQMTRFYPEIEFSFVGLDPLSEKAGGSVA